MKRRLIVSCIALMWTVMLLICGQESVCAANESLENNKNSMVQVVMTYTPEGGNAIVVQSGTGIVINNTTILTNYHNVHINKSNKKKAVKYIKAKLGKKVENVDSNSFQIQVVQKDDVRINASVNSESKKNDFAILTLESEIDRSPAYLGDSSTACMGENVIAFGYPTTKPFTKKGAKYFSQDAIELKTSVVSEVSGNKILMSGSISAGSSGGALMDSETGYVIGLLTYKAKDEKKGSYRAFAINEIKAFIKDIAYTDKSVETPAAEVVTQIPATQVDKSALEEVVKNAEAINAGDYASESYAVMYSYLSEAKKLLEKADATQEEIDSVKNALATSMTGLVPVKKTNWTLIIIIIAAVFVMIAAVIVIILVIKANGNKNKSSQFQTLPTSGITYANNTAAAKAPVTPNYSNSISGSLGVAGGNETTQFMTGGISENLMKPGETTVLNTSNSGPRVNETTVLNSSQLQVNGYIVRKKTGVQKLIDSVEYTIGKDRTKVNFCVEDNEAISRCHMKIVKRGMNFYAVDLNSTNYTYVNDQRVMPGEEKSINNNDVIKVADEEFAFLIQ